ncbi:DUF418 domain-containing protein [Aurantiacibacter sp. MUD11]|uniref:DUF418 domain-containing protein n=1 Tax=Aurantiacibacter sp. MUD11 TaxID=3003265 RepID=UPI0022AABFA9|nr:DUF418 domain-containing protein [Aurantiacibacter sp. MUD11]WAT17369.1 DUF418 domain-containing protein [Aurantiacibacter sp. MUD11]
MSGTALSAAPSPTRRVAALDALRGLAVIGIVPMNVIAFAMPANAYLNPRVWGGTDALETALWAVSFVFVEDKFRALFAMMFGAGVAILLGRGEHPLRAHYARMAVLLGIGVAHAVLLANNDVLRIYAVCGLLLPLAMRWKVRTLVWAAVALVAAQLVVSGYVAWGWLDYWYQRASGMIVDPAAQEIAERTYGAHPDTTAAALERGREAFGDRVERRLGVIEQQARFVVASMPSALAAMLLGMALWRARLLAGEWSTARAMRLARWCIVPALPVLAVLAGWSIASGFDPIVTTANAIVWSAPFDILLATGYAALAMALFGGALRDNPATRLLAAAGRMALTNYLATSVIFAALFAGWGLGLFGEVSRGPALLLCLLPIAAMLAWSAPWLTRFRQGPLEWLWRSLAATRLLPFRKPPAG